MAGTLFGDVGAPFFVAGATFGDVAVSLFVVGATFGDAGMSLFVAGATFGDAPLTLSGHKTFKGIFATWGANCNLGRKQDAKEFLDFFLGMLQPKFWILERGHLPILGSS